MVPFNTLRKLCVVVAFGLSATVTSTDIPEDQSTQKALDIGSLRDNEELWIKPADIQKPIKIVMQENTDEEEPPKFSVEWLLLPKPENRVCLLEKLPFDVAKDVPKDCDEPIDAALEKRIRKFFSLSEQEQQSKRRRFILPLYLKTKLGIS